jgi:hypothetical protein
MPGVRRPSAFVRSEVHGDAGCGLVRVVRRWAAAPQRYRSGWLAHLLSIVLSALDLKVDAKLGLAILDE